MKEIWKDIEGYEGYYQVSNMGRVRSLDRITIRKDAKKLKVCGKLLKLNTKESGYIHVTLTKNSKPKTFSVHRLVAITFLENKENKSQVNHLDGIKNNNHVDNLEWCTFLENIRHARQNNLYPVLKGEKTGASKLTKNEVLEILYLLNYTNLKQTEIAKMYGTTKGNIYCIKQGKSWKHLKEKSLYENKRRILEKL